MERIPFPEKIIKWSDIARGIGQVVVEEAVHFLLHRHRYEPTVPARPVAEQPPEQLEIDFENPPVFHRPEDYPGMYYVDHHRRIKEMTNRWDSEGRYFEE